MRSDSRWCCPMGKSPGSARVRAQAKISKATTCAARASAAKGCLASSRAFCSGSSALRRRAFGAIGRLRPNFITQDGVVPRSKLPQMMEFIRECSRKYQLRIPNVFHAGDGNIHPLILYDERDADQIRRALQASEAILMKCIDFGGSVTGEHGIGVEKIDFMSKQFTVDDLEAMRMLRRVFDPDLRCNPHKMFPGSKRCADFALKKQAAA